MKPQFYHIFFIIGISGWMMSCGNSAGGNTTSLTEENKKEKNVIEKKDTSPSENDPSKKGIKKDEPEQFDASAFFTDTTLYLENYHIIIGKEKFDASNKEYNPDDIEYNSLVIYFNQKDNDSVILKKVFEENQFVKLFSFKEKNTQYISLSNYSGGSGFTSTIYEMKLGDEPSFTRVFDYNELTFYAFSKDGSELLYMQGIWDMSEAEGESHYSEHRYTIATVNLVGKHQDIAHGTTKHKYPSYDYETTTEMLMHMINKKEPEVFKNVDLNKYVVQ